MTDTTVCKSYRTEKSKSKDEIQGLDLESEPMKEPCFQGFFCPQPGEAWNIHAGVKCVHLTQNMFQALVLYALNDK